MLDTVTEKALAAINVHLDSNTTSLPSELFPTVRYSIEISSFVATAVIRQPAEIVNALSWHIEHSSDDLKQYLFEFIKPTLFLDPSKAKLDEIGCRPAKSSEDFEPEYHLEHSMMALVRKLRYQHAAAIAILELNNLISIEESSARMSFLAEALVQLVYFWSYAFQREKYGAPCQQKSAEQKETKHQNLIILAMGKFGGSELNFSSDIDLIFFYESEGITVGGKRSIETNRFFNKLGVQIIRMLDEVTEDGFAFRVDMRLRPYGESGNLVMSLSQAEDYYHEQGRGWERFAMVRARAITGTADEINSLNSIIVPFSFRRYIDYGVIDSLRNMKSMIQREVRRRNLKGNIKLGAGGIREIEFMVQSLQLIQGGRNKLLQEKNLLAVLPLLVNDKLLAKKTANDLMNSYRYLRRLEHCIQELDEKQTQQLPEDDAIQQIIAQVMGFDDWQSFKLSLDAHLENTNQHFSSLFGEDNVQENPHDDFFISLWELHINAQGLAEKTHCNLETANRIIQILTDFRQSNLVVNLSVKGTKRLNQFFPILMKITLELEQPLEALLRLLTVLRAILMRTAYLELLSENSPLLRHLVDLVSRSEWVVKRLSECPILLDELLYPNTLYQPLQTSDLHNELRQNLLRIDETDEELLLDAIRQFKLTNELRVAAALLAQRLSISQVSRYLTELAQVIIQVALKYSWNKVTSKQGKPSSLESSYDIGESTGFLVIGYGKLGGFELGFNSDLDLVFLFDQSLNDSTDGAKPIPVAKFYTRLAQKLLHFLSTRTSLGVLYEVDMRLRPSGNSGLLVSHIDTFESYQKENAWTWEHQAITRARAIAGDSGLGDAFNRVREEVIHAETDIVKVRSDVISMRAKMRKSLDASKAGKLDLKQCEGGLVDIEFIAQYLVLSLSKSSQKEPTSFSYTPTNTAELIKFFQQHEKIEQEAVTTLITIYRKYRNHLNLLSIVGGNRLVCVKLFKSEIEKIKNIWKKVFSGL